VAAFISPRWEAETTVTRTLGAPGYFSPGLLLFIRQGKDRRLRPAPFLLYLPDMSDPSELYVEVRAEEIIVVVPHSTYAATYCRSKDSSSLLLTQVSSPDKNDPRSTQTPAQFLGLAWQAANDKARELGWIV